MICPDFNGQCFGYCITADWMHPVASQWGEGDRPGVLSLFFTVLVNQGVMADVDERAGECGIDGSQHSQDKESQHTDRQDKAVHFLCTLGGCGGAGGGF